MSHVTAMKTKAGKPLITNLQAVLMAAQNLGLVCTEKSHYRTWKDDHGGNLVGDWNVPPGLTTEQLGDNAVLVLSMSPEQKAARGGSRRGEPYEIGICPDPRNPGAYYLMYDFYSGGMGIDEVVGRPQTDRATGEAEVIAPTFMQHYQMICAKLAARDQGDEIEFEKQQDGSWLAYAVPTEERLREAIS